MKRLLALVCVFSVLIACNREVPVSSITLSSNSVEIIEGQQFSLSVRISPENSTNKTVEWYSSDGNVATVSHDGLVTAVKRGSTTIIARIEDKTASCSITVIPIPATSVELDKVSAALMVGESIQLTVSIKPDNADKKVTWRSSNSNVAIVENGKVTAINIGEAMITVHAGNLSASCNIKVILEGDNDSLEYEEWEI